MNDQEDGLMDTQDPRINLRGEVRTSSIIILKSMNEHFHNLHMEQKSRTKQSNKLKRYFKMLSGIAHGKKDTGSMYCNEKDNYAVMTDIVFSMLVIIFIFGYSILRFGNLGNIVAADLK